MLHNFIQKNEKRKLLLWLDLFANSKAADHYFAGNIDTKGNQDSLPVASSEVIVNKELVNQKLEKNALDIDKIMKTALDAVQTSAKSAPLLPGD